MKDAVATKVVNVKLTKITIPEGRRTVNSAVVASLAESMSVIGQQTPVTVARIKGTWRLVAGLHRIEAAKQLGWEKVRAVRLAGKRGVDRRLWERSENLHRADLTALEKAEAIDRWRRLTRKESKVAQLARPGGKQPTDKGISRAANNLGFSRDQVRRAKEIARIADDVKVAVKKAGLDDNQAALLKIAKGSSPKEQHQILETHISGKSRSVPRKTAESAEIPSTVVGPPAKAVSARTYGVEINPLVEFDDIDIPSALLRLSEQDQVVGDELMQIWSAASPAVRKWFLGRVLRSAVDVSCSLARLNESDGPAASNLGAQGARP